LSGTAATLTLGNGGIASGGSTSAYGQINVDSGGYASGMHLGPAGFLNVYGGGTISSLSVTGGLVEVVSGGESYHSVISSGGDEFVASGLASGTVISSGGFSVIGNAGTAENTVIAGGGFELASKAKLEGGVSFTAPDGVFIIDSPESPAVPISGFVAGDQISFGLLYSSNADTVAVKTAGIVTVSAGGYVYNLHIAGAVVGSKAFQLGQDAYGLDLTTTLTSATQKQAPLTGSQAFASVPELAANIVQGRLATLAAKEAAPTLNTSSTQTLPGLSGIVTLLQDHGNGISISNLLATPSRSGA
jgi:autotransporter passenger strand-loop-strand repeat protein